MILELEQEIYKMSFVHLIVPKSKKVLNLISKINSVVLHHYPKYKMNIYINTDIYKYIHTR